MTPHKRAPHHDHDADDCTGFDYLFPDADGPTYDHTALGALQDALAPGRATDVKMPAKLAHFTQFILNDITQHAATDPEYLSVAGASVIPRCRTRIRHVLVNQRSGRLALDSVYGDPAISHPALQKLSALLRDRKDAAKMRIGRFTPTEVIAANTLLQQSGPGDLLRLHEVMNDGGPSTGQPITIKDLLDLPQDARELFVRRDGTVDQHRAIIGDSRNDAAPQLAAVHLSVLRLHNALVDCYPLPRAANDYEQAHAWARREVRLHMQWIILHDYLPQICDPNTLRRVLKNRAPAYRAFRAKSRLGKSHHQPIPIEFLIGLDRAIAHLGGLDDATQLDTQALRQSVRLNLPTAQNCIAHLNKTYDAQLPVVEVSDLASAGTLAHQTPLWFYVLKEAQTLGQGTRLGPLGSTLVAETLVGNLSNDHASVLHQPGSVDGRWHPQDSTANLGLTIDSFDSLMRVVSLP